MNVFEFLTITNLTWNLSSFKVSRLYKRLIASFGIFCKPRMSLDLNELSDTLGVKNHNATVIILFSGLLIVRIPPLATFFILDRPVDEEADRSHWRNLSPVPLLPWFSTGLSLHCLAFNPRKKRGMAARFAVCPRGRGRCPP